MKRISCAATALLALCIAGVPAAADDAATCRNGTGDDKIAACNRLLQRNPKDEVAAYERGTAYFNKREYDRAIADLGQAIQVDPRYAAAYQVRGLAYARKGEYDRAIADYDQAIQLRPNFTYAYDARGEARAAKGKYDRAIADYDQAIRIDSQFTMAYNNRGTAYAFKREFRRAIADYDKALEINPDFVPARQNRERVQAEFAASQQTARPQVADATPSARGQRRVALVIGNSAYRDVPALANPQRDAETVADALRQTGFETVVAMDLDRSGMENALRAFRDRADSADWALVYFAGHGIMSDHVNYLIPTDAKLRDERDVTTEAVSYEEVLKTVGGARTLRLIVLDACRNNPFADRMHRAVTSRSTSRGLAPPPEPDAGTLIAFSARDGQVAADDVDSSANSPFARAFVQELRKPGLEVRRLFDLVRDDVMELTGRRQQPYSYQSLSGRQEYFFVAGK
jgi:tetratricopeptide (TPR) repeat protein